MAIDTLTSKQELYFLVPISKSLHHAVRRERYTSPVLAMLKACDGNLSTDLRFGLIFP
uniref:Uncharacterized protein n=1 Tax=Anguilla anguilla TaxID=7936 RepID=A0A0E9S8A1_ANGAN